VAGHVGAVDFARYAVGRGVPHELGFDEVAAPINALRVVVLEQDTAYESMPSTMLSYLFSIVYRFSFAV
jgi:hypothetical protein